MARSEEPSAPEVLDQLFAVTPGLSRKQKASVLHSGTADATSGLLETGLALRSDGSFAQIENCERVGERFVSDKVLAACFEARFGETPSTAELGLLKVLLTGGSLRDASRMDGRSYQTKRNQLASLKAKAGLNGQSELLQTMAVLLAETVESPVATSGKHLLALQTFMERHYASNHRLHRIMLPSRRELVVADIGPLTGDPVLFVHSSFYPLLPLPHQANLLDRRHLRVIVPMRPGAFGAPAAPVDKRPTGKSSIQDICHVLQIFGLRDAPVIGHGAGAILAVDLARAAPNPDRQIVLSSPQCFGDKARRSLGFSRSWAQFCSHHPNLIAPLIHNLIGQFVSPDFFLAVLRRAYQENPDDIALYQRVGHYHWFRELLAMVASRNAVGLTSDFVTLSTQWHEVLSPGDARFTVVYGERDNFSGSEWTIPRLAASGAELIVRPGFGQDGNVFDAELLFDLALRTQAGKVSA